MEEEGTSLFFHIVTKREEEIVETSGEKGKRKWRKSTFDPPNNIRHSAAFAKPHMFC